MEWVETTGKSLDEAREAALDQLGVDEADAEFEIVSEGKLGLFGRVKEEARVRARVRPAQPRSKENNRRKRKGGPDGASTSSTRKPERQAPSQQTQSQTEPPRNKPRRKPKTEQNDTSNEGAAKMDESVALADQAEVAQNFLNGLFSELQLSTTVDYAVDDEEELVSVAIEGSNMGHLIGPRGSTLHSLQELTRTVVQRKTGARNGRIVLDIAKYREKRKAALERFARQVAEEVTASSEQRVLEPMNPADRKIVHDVINGIDGVATSSEGEEPRRRVVIKPAEGA